jgi:uncharacterized membrane protein HdeD (DUF308 family)
MMLAVLAADWGLLLTRAALALVLGVLLLVWREPGPDDFVLVFGLYTLADGLAAGIVAFGARGTDGAGSLFAEAAVRAGSGVLALAAPGLVLPALPILVGLWAALSGLAQISVAAALRRELAGHWPIPVAAAFSLGFAIVCIVGQHAPLQLLAWEVAVYALLFFAVLMAFAHRMWQLACEMAKA